MKERAKSKKCKHGLVWLCRAGHYTENGLVKYWQVNVKPNSGVCVGYNGSYADMCIKFEHCVAEMQRDSQYDLRTQYAMRGVL